MKFDFGKTLVYGILGLKWMITGIAISILMIPTYLITSIFGSIWISLLALPINLVIAGWVISKLWKDRKWGL